MTRNHSIAADGEVFDLLDAGQDWRVAWYPASSLSPNGIPHGAAAICFTAGGLVVLVSADGGATWSFPGGRPEPGEDARSTLEREIREEACAQIQRATLVGFSRGECLRGRERGLVLVRSLWSAVVALHPWEPQHETTHRRLVAAAPALDVISFPPSARPIYARWVHEAAEAGSIRDSLR
jgi:8-oxo-dGTP pyrophosphatase MutT (NUDIX family)